MKHSTKKTIVVLAIIIVTILALASQKISSASRICKLVDEDYIINTSREGYQNVLWCQKSNDCFGQNIRGQSRQCEKMLDLSKDRCDIIIDTSGCNFIG
jgi:hypothetical protein